MTEPKRKRGRPIVDEKKVSQNVSFLPSDLKALAKINPSISEAIRQVMKERKEQRKNG